MNTIVAKALREFYDVLSKAKDLDKAIEDLVHDTYIKHRRIVYNGNNYSSEWVEEAAKRGLMNLPSSPDAYDTFMAPKNIALFEEFGIYNSVEMHSRYEILHEEYSKTIHIEALTLIDMINRQVLPAVMEFSSELAEGIVNKKAALPGMNVEAEEERLAEIEGLVSKLYAANNELDKAVKISSDYEGSSLSHYSRSSIIPAMEEVRKYADQLELIVGQKHWPYPTSGEMLFDID